jgi:hypothetical protein
MTAIPTLWSWVKEFKAGKMPVIIWANMFRKARLLTG